MIWLTISVIKLTIKLTVAVTIIALWCLYSLLIVLPLYCIAAARGDRAARRSLGKSMDWSHLRWRHLDIL